MKIPSFRATRVLAVALFALSIGVGVTASPGSQGSARSRVRLSGHVPREALRTASWTGRMAPEASVSMAITLPLRNLTELRDLLNRIYDPTDPMYGNYLTPQEFTDRFCPTQTDYDAVAGYMRSLGLKITGTHSNRTLLNVSGPAGTLESAFNLRMHRYLASDGREFHAPDNDPEVPDFIAARIVGVVGLENAAVWHTHNRYSQARPMRQSPTQIGSGPGGGLTPNDIKSAYNLDKGASVGSGQVLGLFELSGYTASDVTAYENSFGLPYVPLQNVLVDGYSGKAGSGADEVTLDIELQIALAPGASQIMVYEGPNTNTGVLDTYNRIATDNLAKQISTSWGLSETQSSSSVLTSENAIFLQMAAQGQSIYAASGDSGAYDNGRTLSVDDPASQPFVVGTGGTQLFVTGAGGTYTNETTWNVNNTVSGGAGGGGVSVFWAIPSYQQGVSGLASTTARNVPDVSLNADQYTGYSIYYKGGWYIFGGTSCAAPLWAAFTAQVNQQRGTSPTLGFANYAIYQIAGTSADFHDITSGTNLYYSANSGYDNATGWGSIGPNLMADLVSYTPAIPPAPTNLTATAGDTTVTLAWTASAGATSYNVLRGSSTGGESSYRTGIALTSYTDTGLTNGTTYFYKVTATNAAGTSDASNEASATPIAPTLNITSGPTATPGRGSAVIRWTTNVASNSVVQYGINSNLQGSTTTTNNSQVTSHSISLSGLQRQKTYYYKVTSKVGSATATSTIYSFITQ